MKSPTASYNYNQTYLNILIQPFPFVRKNMSLSLFQEISLTSNLNCSSPRARCVWHQWKSQHHPCYRQQWSDHQDSNICWCSLLNITIPHMNKPHKINRYGQTGSVLHLWCWPWPCIWWSVRPRCGWSCLLMRWRIDQGWWMPAQLIHTVSMPSVVVLLHLIREIQV